MKDTFFNVSEADRARLATVYNHTERGLEKPERPLVIGSPAYFSGAGRLVSTVGDYFRLAQMLCIGGELDGVRILSPCLNAAEARVRKPNGSYGWDGAFGTYWWVNRREQMVAILFVQTPGRAQQYDFDNALSQAVVE